MLRALQQVAGPQAARLRSARGSRRRRRCWGRYVARFCTGSSVPTVQPYCVGGDLRDGRPGPGPRRPCAVGGPGARDQGGVRRDLGVDGEVGQRSVDRLALRRAAGTWATSATASASTGRRPAGRRGTPRPAATATAGSSLSRVRSASTSVAVTGARFSAVSRARFSLVNSSRAKVPSSDAPTRATATTVARSVRWAAARWRSTRRLQPIRPPRPGAQRRRDVTDAVRRS